jgi:hypothetical protein
MSRKNWLVVGGTICMYVLMLLFQGYQFGRGDLVQLDPLVLFHQDASLFSGDLYVQNAVSGFPNERYFFMLLIQNFPGHLEWISFFLHMAFSILLLAGIYQLASRYIHDTILRLAVPFILFIPLYAINLGSNELYYGMFHPSLVSKSIGIWAIVLWLNRRVIAGILLSILATLFHPVAGLQVFTLIVMSEAIWSFSHKKSLLPKRLVIGIIIWFCTAGIFLLAVHRRFESNIDPGMDLYQIFYIFRNPHHYLPTHFGSMNWLILIPAFLVSWILWYKQDKKLFFWYVSSAILLAIYTYGVEIRSETITTLQWFKSSIWLELFSVISILAFLESISSRFHAKKISTYLGTAFLIVSILWGLKISPGISFLSKGQYYDFPFMSYTDDAIDISKQAKEKTSKDALFIHPCHFTELTYFGERSSYVDYKALTHTKIFLSEWARRMEQVYQIDFDTSPAGFYTCSFADEQLMGYSAIDLTTLAKNTGITHLLTYRRQVLDLPVIAQNATYVIYALAD